MNKDRIILTLSIIAFVLALLSAIASYQNINLTGNQVNDQGNATLTITENLQINFTTDTIDWGSGRVDNNENFSRLNSEGTVTNSTTNPWSTVNNGLVLENIGNTNATIELYAGSNASTFIGGGQGSAKNPEYKWKASNDEANSCGTLSDTSYTSVNTTDPGTTICDPLKYENSNDQLEIDIEVVVPYDANTGSKTDTLTATATAV